MSKQTKLISYEGKATRSALAGRYDLIPREAIDAIAVRLELGASIHGENNWKKGGEKFRIASINHLYNHLLEYQKTGNLKDLNTDAIICNAAFLCYYEKLKPFLGYDNPKEPKCQTKTSAKLRKK